MPSGTVEPWGGKKLYLFMLFTQAVTSSDCTHRKVGWLLGDDLVGIWKETVLVFVQVCILGFAQIDWGRQRPRYEPVTSGIQVEWVTTTLGCSVPSGVEYAFKCKPCSMDTVLHIYHDGAVAPCLTSHILFHGAPRGLGAIHYRRFKITLTHTLTTLGRAHPDEWSARRTDLSTSQHRTLTTDRHP